MAARSDVRRAPIEISSGAIRACFFDLLRRIASRVRQQFFMVEYRAEIAHIEPTTARFAFVNVLGLAQRRFAHSLAGIVGVMQAILVTSLCRPVWSGVVGVCRDGSSRR
jgi:hypothetical protein